jgi:hypothetical protein
MDKLLTKNLLSYGDWANAQSNFIDRSQPKYLEYLNNWYNANNINNKNQKIADTKRNHYVQLIKDLSYLFNKDEKDMFLSDIDFNDNEDLIYAIPYLVQKLKEISQIICAKREETKNIKTKNSLIGSNLALEKILYEYILKNFTKKPYSYTRVPISPLANIFPELSAVNKDFYIEIEELYDTNTYHDFDPSVDIFNYYDINNYSDSKLTENDIMNLFATNFLPKVADTPLSKVFKSYLTTISTLSTTALASLSGYYNKQINNKLAANQLYLSENVYGLTAVKTGDLNLPNTTLNLNFQQGNNWFFWPSGDKLTNDTTIADIFKPIPINQSNLVLNRKVSGTNHTDSDLIFTDKDGEITGAWLQGDHYDSSFGTMSATIVPNTSKRFIFPYVGFDISPKTLSFKGYKLDDETNFIYESLASDIKTQILSSYYTGTLPNSACRSIYLNNTNLVECGANPAYFSDEADTIVMRLSSDIYNVYNDNTLGASQQAYLYKFDKTDILINSGTTDIIWPVGSYDGDDTDLPLTLDNKTCLPTDLSRIDLNQSMLGAIPGTGFYNSDIIYKLSDKSGTMTNEAAWLGAGTVSQLDVLTDVIPVYSTSAVDCADYLDGPILPALALKVDAGQFISFIWMDKDTPADHVFLYREHSLTCPYGKTYPHDFYKNQDYQNKKPLNGAADFPLANNPCTCRSVNYSPIGHQGNTVTEYNGMADYLFADPKGMGENFTFKDWKDTRHFDCLSSPQFSFYQIDGVLDQQVGFGSGRWKTGNGTPMILKTGRRYTYARTSLRKGIKNSLYEIPYLLCNYPYKHISINCPRNYSDVIDLMVVIDNSRTEKLSVDITKDLAKNITTKLLNSNIDIKVGLISFAKDALVLNYLTRQAGYIVENIDRIIPLSAYPAFKTNIGDALLLANNVLHINQPQGYNCDVLDQNAICGNLENQIVINSGYKNVSNCPRPNAAKKIMIFSDGQETYNEDTAIPNSENIKLSGVEIISMDIGYFSGRNNIMETVATSGSYFNLENYVNSTDFDSYNFVQYVALRILGCFPTLPVWCKATRDKYGVWTALNERSDMMLNAGDYLTYVHQSGVTYTAGNSTFTVPAISFPINQKLDGWDYTTASFSLTSIGESCGAKPFWGKMYTQPEGVFNKETISFGGQVRYGNGYVPLHQPEISNMKLFNNCYIEYLNVGGNNINWVQDLSFVVHLTSQQWNKLKITKEYSNLSFTLNSKTLLDLITEYTYEPSDIVLESYSQFKPAKYNFYLRNSAFNFKQDLYKSNICSDTLITFTSGVVLEVIAPYLNLDNIHFPTVATFSLPINLVSRKDTGYYLTPDKLGVSHYRGKGYTIELDADSLTYVDSNSSERLFLNLNKYGPRNRGLTKKDQISPVKISNIDNRWMMYPFNSDDMAGVIIDTVANQKLTPYQSNYEIEGKNENGLCYQDDDFQFWDLFYNWTTTNNYPLSLRNEMLVSSFTNRTTKLLTDIGIMTNWRTDIFGNSYGLFKDYDNSYGNHILTENELSLTTEHGILIDLEG